MLYQIMKFKREDRSINALEYAVLTALLLGFVVAGVQMLNTPGLFTKAGQARGVATSAAAQ